jgi:hypothetical protein
MKTNDNTELLNWARKHKRNVERRNEILKVIFGFGFALVEIVGVFYINLYELVTLTSFLQGFFFELGVLIPVFLISFGIYKRLTNTNDAAVAVAVAAVAAAVAVEEAAVQAVPQAEAVAVAAAVAAVAVAAVAIFLQED